MKMIAPLVNDIGTMPHGRISGSISKVLPNKKRDQRRTVFHFTPNIGGGGAEAMLANLVGAMNPRKWRNVVVVADGHAWPKSAAKLKESGAELYDLGSPSLLSPTTLVRLFRLLRQIRPDVIQTWMHQADLIGGWCARLTGFAPIVWGIHCREIIRNPGDSERKLNVFRHLLGWSSHMAPRRIVSCSTAAIDNHAAMGYPKAKMTWVPNGIDTTLFAPDYEAGIAVRRELHIPERAPLIGYLGSFHERKDLATWLKAAAILQARMPYLHFLLCGGSEMDLGDCARAALSVMPHRNQVHFTNFRSDPERLYNALDAFSLSSRTEACPLALMEALSCGVPCVATDVGDCRRLLQGMGHVVPPRNAESLARGWERALATLAPTRAHIRKLAVQRFDIAAVARAYEALYQEVVGK